MFISFLILYLVPFSDGNCFQKIYGKQTKDYKLEGFQIFSIYKGKRFL